ncbi:MAG: methyltransferase, partial [Desulfobacteraceae bacterium]|nr:methyltransferase [Desulfobacteraceae bacterium]
EYKAIYTEYKGTRKVENSHRVRIAIIKGSLYCIFLTDSKIHKKPEKIEVQPDPMRVPKFMERSTYKAPEHTKFDDMNDSLKNGVQTVSASQLFPTPDDLAQRMVNYAGLKKWHTVLEPSAGTGSLLNAAKNTEALITAVELNLNLCDHLKAKGFNNIKQGDFLTCNGDLGVFDRIIMNPPFEKGQDIKHIKHALKFLKSGGRLVALCANGPRQTKEVKPLVKQSGGDWEDLPPGTFKSAGTMVNTAMLIIEG